MFLVRVLYYNGVVELVVSACGSVKDAVLKEQQTRKQNQADKDDAAKDPDGVQAKRTPPDIWQPGRDYQVRGEVNLKPDVVVFPLIEGMDSFRHQWILRRRKRPIVPAPTHTPMPDKASDKDDKCRLLSLYMRPWVLDRRFASRHVPHITNLDVVFDREARTHATTEIGSYACAQAL